MVRESLAQIERLHDKFALVYALVALAAAAEQMGDDAWAARILAVRDAVTERTGAIPVDHSVRDLRERVERDARARLGRAVGARIRGRPTRVRRIVGQGDRRTFRGVRSRPRWPSSEPAAARSMNRAVPVAESRNPRSRRATSPRRSDTENATRGLRLRRALCADDLRHRCRGQPCDRNDRLVARTNSGGENRDGVFRLLLRQHRQFLLHHETRQIP